MRIINQELNPQVIFKSLAYAKIIASLKTTISETLEYMFLGSVEKIKTNKTTLYIINDIHIVPQTANSGAYCETDDEKFPEWLMTQFSNNEERMSLRLHGHSHVRMAVNPSQIDENCLQQLMRTVSDYFIQIIINKKEEIKINVWDKEKNIVFEDLPAVVKIGDSLITGGPSPNKIISIGKIKTVEIEEKDNQLFINDHILFMPETMSYMIFDDHLTFTENKLEETDKKLVEELQTELFNKIKRTLPNYYGKGGIGASPYISPYGYGYDYGAKQNIPTTPPKTKSKLSIQDELDLDYAQMQLAQQELEEAYQYGVKHKKTSRSLQSASRRHKI